MMTFRRLALVFCLAAMALATVGCGRSDLPELGRVQGTVTLDGKPLPGVIVQFSPKSGGRMAVANVDKDGKYDVMFTADAKGTKTGINLVSVVWPDGAEAAAKIPAKYGAKSELSTDVKPGKNTFDITMQSK